MRMNSIGRWLAFALLLTAAVAVPAAPARAATGVLDPSFGTNGRIGVAGIADLAVTADGKIWINGVTLPPTSRGVAKVLVRVDRNGHADPSFTADPLDPGWEGLGAGDLVPTPAGGAITRWDICCNGVEPISYVELGYKTVSGRPADFGSFSQGVRIAPDKNTKGQVPSTQAGGGLIRLPDGRFRICITEGSAFGGDNLPSVALWGLMPDGAPDLAVGPDGLRLIPGLSSCGTRTYAEREGSASRGLFLDQTGRMYVIGQGTRASAADNVSTVAVRTDVNGKVDTSYGDNGQFTLGSSARDYTATDAEVTQAGTLFLGMNVQDTASGSQPVATIAKVTPAGVLDPAFGLDGVKRFTVAGGLTRVDSLGTLPNSRLAVAMTYIAGGQRVGRLTAVSATTAQPDRTFGVNGSVKTGLRVFDTALQSGNRLLLGGRVMSSDPAIEPLTAVVERLLT